MPRSLMADINTYVLASGRQRLQAACILVAVLTLLVRLPFIIDPGMSTDSYAYLDGWPTLEQLAGQGRFGQFLVFRLFGALAIDPLTFATLLQGLGIALLGLSTPLLFAAFSTDEQIRLLPLCLAGLVVTLHPYAAEILTFSEASFTALLATAMGVVAIYIVARRQARWWISVALLVAALSMYQLLLNYACLMILFGALKIHLRTQAEARWTLAPYRPLFIAAGVLLMSLVIYLVLHKTFVAALGIKEVGRAAFLPLGQIAARLEDMRTLTGFLWKRPLLVDYGVAARALLWTTVLCGWAVLAGYLLRRPRVTVLLPLAVMLLVPWAGIGVVAAGALWWPAPRILGGIVLVWAMGIYWLAWVACGRWGKRLVAATSAVLLLSFVAVGHRVHSDQQQLNGFDRLLAQRVYTGLIQLEGYTEQTPVAVVNSRLKWAHPLPLATAYMDLNLTAFADKRAIKGLLELSNGRRLQFALPGEADTRYCEAAATWPQPGFATMQADHALVCL